jgi:hypothetical protein
VWPRLHINRLWFPALQIAAARFSGSCQHGTLSRGLRAELAQAEETRVWFEMSSGGAAIAAVKSSRRKRLSGGRAKLDLLGLLVNVSICFTC